MRCPCFLLVIRHVICSQEFPHHGAAGSDRCHRRVYAESGGSSGSLHSLNYERTARVNTGPLQSQPGQDCDIRSVFFLSCPVLSCLFFSQTVKNVLSFIVNQGRMAPTPNDVAAAGTTAANNSVQATAQNTSTVTKNRPLRHKCRTSSS